MITITKQAPLIVIETPERVIYQGVDVFAFGFDVEDDVATYYAIFYAPIDEFNIDGVQITDLASFEAAIEGITAC